VVRLDCLPYHAKQFSQRNIFRYRAAQRTLRVNAGKFKRRGVKVCSLKRFHVAAMGLGDLQLAIFTHREQSHGDLQYGIGLTVESASFNVHDDGQEPAEPVAHRRSGCGCHDLAVIGSRWVRRIRHRR